MPTATTQSRLREQVTSAVCAMTIGSERVEAVMNIIHRHTAAQVEHVVGRLKGMGGYTAAQARGYVEVLDRAEAAEGQLDDIRQWCHDWSADQWAARAILDRIGWPEQEVTHD